MERPFTSTEVSSVMVTLKSYFFLDAGRSNFGTGSSGIVRGHPCHSSPLQERVVAWMYPVRHHCRETSLTTIHKTSTDSACAANAEQNQQF